MDDSPRSRIALPSWLDGQTVAIIAVVAAVGAMTQNGFTSIRAEMSQLRVELHAEIDQLRVELRAEIGDLRTEVRGLDDRLRTVEVAVASFKADMETFNVRLAAVERLFHVAQTADVREDRGT